MYFHEATYDLKELCRHNLHTHTVFSGCAKREMTVENILRRTEEAGVELLALTDHSDIEDLHTLNVKIPELKKQIEAYHPKIKVLVGSELSAYGVDKYCLKEDDVPMDFHLFSHNHYHVRSWEHPEDRSAYGYKEHCKAVMESVIRSGKADAMAHPFCDKHIVEFIEGAGKDVRGSVTNLWTDNEIGDMLSLGKKYEVAWEINPGHIFMQPAFSRRYFAIGKEIGVTFNMGTDAHSLDALDTYTFLPELERILL